MNLRPYQLHAIHGEPADKPDRHPGIVAALESGNRTLCVIPTGGGKTIVFSKLAELWKAKGERTLILAHREELIDQAVDKLHRSTGIRADVEKAERHACPQAPVVVGSIQSLINEKRRNRWDTAHFGLVIVDEAHHTVAASYRKVLSHFDAWGGVVGVTATPDRGDQRNLGEYFQSLAYEISFMELVKQGFLSPVTIRSVPLSIDLNSVKSKAGDFAEAELAHVIEPYLGEVAKAIREYASDRRTLVFVPLIQTSLKFVSECQRAGLKAVHIDGQTTNRKEILRRFSEWQWDVCSNAMLLTEGFDDATIDCIVCLRPTRSRSLYAQICGRGTRISDLKENLLLLDFLWMHEKHRICRPAHLIAGSDEEAEEMTKIAEERSRGGATQEELELGELATAATHEREAKLARDLEEKAKRKATVISIDDFAAQQHKDFLAEYVPQSEWEAKELTDPQKLALRRAKIDPESIKTRGHASQVIGYLNSNRRVQLASPKAIELMRRMPRLARDVGVHDMDRPTQQEAGRFFAALRDRKASKATPQTREPSLI